MDAEQIARVAHEVNRAYCESMGDTSQVPWEDAPEWQRVSARMGVDLHTMGDFGPEASHISWMKQKSKDGWVYGPVKDAEKKTHPCMVPFDQLPKEQQAKDFIFRAVVHALRPVSEPRPKEQRRHDVCQFCDKQEPVVSVVLKDPRPYVCVEHRHLAHKVWKNFAG